MYEGKKMDPINSSANTGPQMVAMKKAIEVQGEGIMKILESAQNTNTSSASGSSASATGIGQNLDIRG